MGYRKEELKKLAQKIDDRISFTDYISEKLKDCVWIPPNSFIKKENEQDR